MSSAECPTCSDGFASVGGMKSHHAQAHGESIAGVSVKCDWCGKEKQTTHSNRNDHFFCDGQCYGSWLSENRSGKNAPPYIEVNAECFTCGASLERQPSEVEWGERQFCRDKDCEKVWRQSYYAGPGNPNWEGGLLHYGEGWTEKKKEDVRERDGYECQNCGFSQMAHITSRGQKLHVHHIVPARMFEDDKKRNAKSNLTTLCRPCHKSAES